MEWAVIIDSMGKSYFMVVEAADCDDATESVYRALSAKWPGREHDVRVAEITTARCGICNKEIEGSVSVGFYNTFGLCEKCRDELYPGIVFGGDND